MKILVIGVLLFTITSNAQNKLEQIKQCVNNYINGTSYVNIDQINKAFYPDANLYLDSKEGKMNVVPIKTYIGYFKGGKTGKFTGRIGKILNIDYFGNIAFAKAEILFPASNARYVDMFILKIVNDEWKIISKTANSEKSGKKGEQILFVVSNAHFYGTSDISTGNSFSEIVNAYHEFNNANYTIDFVSPNGGAVPLNHIMTSDTLQKKYLYKNDFMYALKTTNKPSEINPKDYKAIYYVGGGATVFGVPENKEIQQIAMTIYEENNGIISSVCHGTAGIVNLKTKDGEYLVKGKTVNGYPDDYENKDAKYYKQFPFKIQRTIEKRNGNFKYGERNKAHVEVDGRLITGQNYKSAKLVAQKIIETLHKQ